MKKENCSAPKQDSVIVTSNYSNKTKIGSYRAIHIGINEVFVESGPVAGASPNILAFLGIVKAMRFMHRHEHACIIYSNNKSAISWVEQKNALTDLVMTEENEPLFAKINGAVKWLIEYNGGSRVWQWDTMHWGKISEYSGQ
ncbi:MAG TPA: hypothetical protein VK783_11080 [Bacteroidia bacterium]|jgi:hypothetical protein|nr:hypothetical protein [Bacteroidia bacterium]